MPPVFFFENFLKIFQKSVDKLGVSRYNNLAVSEQHKTKNAAIAQPVERILGKDEVASSNLASSSILIVVG